jgi:hypothetical protein
MPWSGATKKPAELTQRPSFTHSKVFRARSGVEPPPYRQVLNSVLLKRLRGCRPTGERSRHPSNWPGSFKTNVDPIRFDITACPHQSPCLLRSR